MGIRIVPSSEVRDKMARIIKDVSQEGNACFITQYGKAEAVLISVDRFNELMNLLEDALDEKDELLALRVEEARSNYGKGKGIKFEL